MVDMVVFGEFNREVKQLWEVEVKVVDSGVLRKENKIFVYIEVEDDVNIYELFDGKLIIIVNVYNGRFVGGIIGKVYYKDDDYKGDQNKYSMDNQNFFIFNLVIGDIIVKVNILMGMYIFSVEVEE